MGKLGHEVKRFDFTSGLAIIAVTPEGLKAAPTHAAKAWPSGIRRFAASPC